MHQEVIALLDFHVFQVHAAAAPESLGGVGDADSAQAQVRHLAEHLGGLDKRILHQQIAAVPERGAGTLGKHAVTDGKGVAAPERVLAFEPAVFGLYRSGLLESRLAGVYRDILETDVPLAVKGPLAPVFFIAYYFHSFSPYTGSV